MDAKKSISRMFSVLFVIAMLIGVVAFPYSARAAGILYVTPSGAGNCASWAAACGLQTALTTAVSGDEIWVAAGTYKPTTNTDRTVSFVLKNGVAVYGGFAGTETLRTQRNFTANVTILSGDIDNNDSQTPIITNLTTVTGNATNSYNLVTGSGTNNTAILDGFTITGGNANALPSEQGGGMYNNSGSPALANVIFIGNNASQEGGGIYNYHGNPLLENVTFNSNAAGNSGGGMYSDGSSPFLLNSTFSTNTAGISGGAMLNNLGSSPTLTNVTLSGNSAPHGGGIHNRYASNPTLTHVTFSANIASLYGGGMYNYQSSPILTDAAFSNNTATSIFGGGMYNEYSSSPNLTNVTFSGNSAFRGGGIYNHQDSNPQLMNVTFNGNNALNEGGGIYNSSSILMITNSLFDQNHAVTDGGAIYNAIGDVTILNSTFSRNGALNEGGSIFNSTTFIGKMTVTNSTFFGNDASNNGGGILNLGPMTITNSTLSENTAGINGGGLNNADGTVTILNSTFSGNSAITAGGGIRNDGTMSYTNTIVANSTSGGDCSNFWTISKNTNNLVEDGSCSATLNGDPKLGQLANNGGSTQTMALSAESLAVNTGTDIGCPATDQRGATRPQGSHCDIGAYESPASGGFLWAKSIGGTSNEESVDIAMDSDGNVYTTGYFKGVVDFDPGLGIFNLTSKGLADIFISKLDSTGNFLWAINMGGAGDDEGSDIFIDASNNIYTTGGFFGVADFDPGTGEFNLTSAGGGYDVFISKLNSNGTFLWAKGLGGVGDDYGTGINVDSSNNIYTTGYFNNTVDFDPGVNTLNLTSAGLADIFVSKLDGNGSYLWAKRMGGGSDDFGFSIVLDSSNNIYTTGYFYNTADFDPGAGALILTSAGLADIFISKLDGNGNYVLAKRMGGVSEDLGYSIALDSSNNIYTTGYFYDTADFNPGVGINNLVSAGSYNVFASKLDVSGNFVWARSMGGVGGAAGRSIKLDQSGNAYLIGYFYDTADFDPGIGTFNLISAGQNDVFITKLNIDGNFLWAKSMGGASSDLGYSLALDSGGNIYTTGSFYLTVDFDPDAAIFNLTSLGGRDIFISKLYNDVNPIVSSIIRTNPSPTIAAIVNFTVNFSESVTGVDAGDFTLITTGGVSGAAVSGVSGSGSVYTVTVNTGNGNGTIRLDVVDNNSIVDAVSNPLGGAAVGDGNFTTGEVYTITKPAGGDTTGVFRPSNGLLYLKNANTTGFADVAINYGTGGDYPIAGDWNGDGTATIGIYRNGTFYLRNSNTLGFADIVFSFGTPGDQPVAGDWNGDGVDTIGVYSNGQFLLRNSNSAGSANMSFFLGNPGDVGIAGDWNGDGMDTTGVFRPSNGIIFLKNANTTGFADVALNYGLSGDMPVTGDWNNDGIDTIGVYRNAQFLLRNSNTIGFAEIVFGLGNPGDMPISGNWDGIP